MKDLFRLLTNRNTILITSVLMGLCFGDASEYLKSFTLYFLALVMAFSTSGIEFRSLFPLSQSMRIIASAVTLNYLLGSALLIGLSFLLIRDPDLLNGMVVIAASPPGIAVIPFSIILGGNLKSAVIGTLGSYVLALVLAPVIILVFTSGILGPLPVFIMMVKIIMLPILASRLLRWEPLYHMVEKARGKVIDLGFAFIIYIAVGVNRDVFFNNPGLLAPLALVLILAIPVTGLVFEKAVKNSPKRKEENITRLLFLTVKSSGFTAATSLALFGGKAAVPSAVLSIVVLLYLLFLSIREDLQPG